MVRLRALGGLAVEHAALDDGAAHRRPLAVLALLAVAGDRGMTRDKITAFLWPESDDEHARNSLSRALSSLRRELGVEQLLLGSTALRLNPVAMTSDVQESVACSLMEMPSARSRYMLVRSWMVSSSKARPSSSGGRIRNGGDSIDCERTLSNRWQ